MNIKRMNVNEVETLFPELTAPRGWFPIIRKPQADYYVLFENETPMCFAGIVKTGEKRIEVQGLYANKQIKSATAVFQLIDWIGFHFADCYIKIYVINDIAYWAWKKIGFRTLHQKKMKYWTAYWIEREAIINGKTQKGN